MGQTNAVLRSLGMRTGLYPTAQSEWKKAGLIDCIVESYSDVFNAIGKIALD